MSTRPAIIHPTRARISVPAFHHNLAAVRSYVGKNVKILAVVKANAYGHGMLEMASEAVRSGAEYLGVARVDEALDLRKNGIHHSLLVFEIAPRALIERALAERLELTVCSVEGAKELSANATRLRTKAKVHVKVDTGMGRLGMEHQTAAENIERIALLPRLDLIGIYSHFATSDAVDQTYALRQLGRYLALLEELQKRGIMIPLKHMANSGAIITLPDAYFDMVRPGIMLYGYTPRMNMETTRPLKPVMSLVSAVTFLKRVTKGASISYGRRYYAPRDTFIATVPVGYADGYPRILTNKTSVLIRGKRFPVVGTICMDHVMVDVGRTGLVDVGDGVTFIGRDGEESITAWDIAQKLNTIPYEVTCMVSARVPREHLRRG